MRNNNFKLSGSVPTDVKREILISRKLLSRAIFCNFIGGFILELQGKMCMKEKLNVAFIYFQSE